MIKRTIIRDGKDWGSHEQPAARALKSLVVFELGYGGMITDLSPTRVVVETRILSHCDTTIFEGPMEEMAFLVKVAAYHAMLMGNDEARATLNSAALNSLDRILGEKRGVPLYVTSMAPLILGEASAQIALLSACGITDPETAATIAPTSTKDLVAAVELHQETGTPLPEVMAQLKLATA